MLTYDLCSFMAPKITPTRWNQFKTLLDNKPYTNNCVEGYNQVKNVCKTLISWFNQAYNSSTPHNASLWTIIKNFSSEENMAMTRWRQDMLMVEQVGA